jgi:hypothetical protein
MLWQFEAICILEDKPPNMKSDFIALIANVALTLSFIVALVFGIVQVRVSARDRKERLTLEALRNFQTREFAELIYFVNNHPWPKTMQEFQGMSPSDQVVMIQYGQQMESLGIMVADGYINMDLVDKTLGSFVTTSWDKYKVVFLDMREKIPDPFLGEYFQWLAERIEQRMKEHPRQPFFNSPMARSV